RRDRQPAVLTGGCLPLSPSRLPGLDTPPAFSLTDCDPRSPANRGLAMSASNPQKMLIAEFDRPVYRGCHTPFIPLVRRCDDSKTPPFNRRLVGTVSIFRGGLALELSPCARSAWARTWRACREDLVASRDRA